MSVHGIGDICQKQLGFIPWWKLTWPKCDRAYQNMNMKFFLGFPLWKLPKISEKDATLANRSYIHGLHIWSMFLELNSKYCAALKCTPYNFPSLQIACINHNPASEHDRNCGSNKLRGLFFCFSFDTLLI